MLDKNDIWQDKFNDRSLENESWLEPSEKLFQAIEKEVYPEDKRKPIIWLWLGLSLALVAALIVFKSFNSDSISGELSNPELQTKGQQFSSIKKEDPTQTKSVSDKNTSNEIIGINETKNSNFKKSINLRSTKSAYKAKTIPAILEKNNNVLSLSSYIRQQNTATPNSKSPSHDLRSSFVQNTIQVEALNQIELIDNLFRLPLKEIDWCIKALSNPELNDIDFVDVKSRYTKKNYLLFSTGLSSWDFRLNQNYTTALEPADFTHERGTGYYVSLGYGLQLDSKRSMRMKVDYENITALSGHNSLVVYRIMQVMILICLWRLH